MTEGSVDAEGRTLSRARSPLCVCTLCSGVSSSTAVPTSKAALLSPTQATVSSQSTSTATVRVVPAEEPLKAVLYSQRLALWGNAHCGEQPQKTR